MSVVFVKLVGHAGACFLNVYIVFLPVQSTSNHNPVLFVVIFIEDRILEHALL